jgi:hypothetical protein
MSKPSHVYVLAEDRRQQQLIRRFLIDRGFSAHQMTLEFAPAARGSGEQWVRQNFPRQVGALRHRSRGRRAETVMIAMMDADQRTVTESLIALDRSLLESGQSVIDESNDQIVRLIPKRNVETWILNLNMVEVDEQEDYKHTRNIEEWSSLSPRAAETLYRWSRANFELPTIVVDSLRDGIAEIRRVFL